MFESIFKGLKDSILLAQNDISSSRLAFDNVSVSSVMSQGRLYELEKQVKSNERYLKKLEFHHSKLEELKEQYDVQHKIRDGIRTMGYAYILSPGKLKEVALQSVKVEFKECTEIMCTFESDLESLMGTLCFEMIGIQGFARICCGDIFEVVVKHGDQKWKTRGRAIKNGDQIWENKMVSFKSLFDEPLCIKALEVRGLGKNILLGNKFCETRDLFCAHPQQMTINLNPSGSLKLNLIITWNPLNGIVDGTHFASTSSSHSHALHSINQSLIHEIGPPSEILTGKQCCVPDPNFCDYTSQSYSSESISLSASNSGLTSPNVNSMNESCQLIDCSMSTEDQCIKTPNLMPEHCNLNSWSCPPSEENSDSQSIDSSDNSLNEVLKSLTIMTEDISELYAEVEDLLQLLEEIEKCLKGRSRSGSNISISIESALECFDFLNTAMESIENEEIQNDNDKMSENNQNGDFKRCLKCNTDADGIEDHFSKLSIHSFTMSSGNDDIDLVLTDHLLCCTCLVSSLISCGPFKSVEDSVLRKIRVQLSCLSNILPLLKKKSICLCDIFDENEDEIREIWTTICGNELYCVADHFNFEMESVLKSLAVLDNYMASLVSPRLVCDILGNNQFDPTSRISVFKFKSYFASHKKAHSLLLEFVADALAVEDLKCKNVQKAFYAVSILSKIVPSSYSLYYVGSLLTDSNIDLNNVATSYFKAVCTDDDLKQKIISCFTSMLQSEDISYRIISCKVLQLLQAKQCSGELSYVAEKDSESSVREAAISTLNSFGTATL